ncbi:MAG TPA: hypothetical protein PLS53_16510 [Thermoanaerobaculaceae bacterium]|nr:hypothetical protein [Thermoanaerobaculaceae bacterium]HPS79763.1 hypothetical protein [Thermoanaerobaculaceae bacterium]
MRTPLALTLPLVGTVLLTGCFSSRPIGGPEASAGNPSPLGSFTVSSRVLGDQVLTPSSCRAGDRQLFLGADFAGSTSPLVLRLVVDPLDGPAVRVFSTDAQFDKTVVFRRSDCQVFHFSLDSTGWRINDVYDYRVTLQLDCSREGESIKGEASATHCS